MTAMICSLFAGIPVFGAGVEQSPEVLFTANFDDANPTPLNSDSNVVSIGSPTNANDGNAMKFVYKGDTEKKGVSYSVKSFTAGADNVVVFDFNRNAGSGPSYFYIELWDANKVGKVYRISASKNAKNTWYTYAVKTDGTALYKTLNATAWESAEISTQTLSNGTEGTNALRFKVAGGTVDGPSVDIDNVAVYSKMPAISVIVPTNPGEEYEEYAVNEDYEEATNIFTSGAYGTGMKDIVSFIPETTGSENTVMDLDLTGTTSTLGQWVHNVKSVKVDFPSPAVGFNVSYKFRRLNDYLKGDNLTFGTSYDSSTRLVVSSDTEQFDKNEWYEITYDVYLNNKGKASIVNGSAKKTKISTGETTTLTCSTGEGWSSSIAGTVAVCISNSVTANQANEARRSTHYQLDDIEVTYEACDLVSTSIITTGAVSEFEAMLVGHDENGILTAVVEPQSTTSLSADFDIMEKIAPLKAADSVKVMYWDSVDNAKAFAPAVEIGDSLSADNSTETITAETLELSADMRPSSGTGNYTVAAYTVPFPVDEDSIPAYDPTQHTLVALDQSNTAITSFKYNASLYDGETQDIVIICNAEGAAAPVVTLYEENDAPQFTNVAMLLGADLSQRNFTWYSLDKGAGKLTYEKKSEMIDGEFSANATIVNAERCHDDSKYSTKNFYYQNSAVMTGLEPETTYVYQLSNGNAKSEKYEIKIADTDSSFSFAFGGDAQVGGSEYVDYAEEYKNWGLSLKQMTTAPEFEGVEFFLHAGDQVDTEATMDLTEAQYDIYLNHDEFKTFPQVVTLGNHDVKLDGVHMQHFNEPITITKEDGSYYGEMASGGGAGLDGADYYFVYNSVLFMHINLNTFEDLSSNIEKEPTTAAWEAAIEANRADDEADAAEHIEFMEKVYEATKDNKDILWTVVYCHQSPFGSSYHGNYETKTGASGELVYSRSEQYNYINIREYLLPYFYESGVDLVLSGHDHTYTRTHILKPNENDDILGDEINNMVISPYANTSGANYYTYEDGTTSPTYKAWTDANKKVFDGSSANRPYLKVSSKPVKVTDPDGFLWVTGATSSGSQVNAVYAENHYAAVALMAQTRHLSRIDVTPTSLTLNTYNLGTNTTEDVTLVDTFTIEKTATVPVQGVSLPESETVAVGQTKTLVADLTPAQPTNAKVTWVSDADGVASVDANGVVTAVSKGTANITVTTEDGEYTATCAVTVVDAVPVTKVDVADAVTVEALKTKTLAANIAPDNATTKKLSWTSNNEAIASVDENGNVTAHLPGEALITAAATDGSGVSATCTVTVSYVASTSSISKTELSMMVSETDSLSVSITPQNATFNDVVWSSSNEAAVTVDKNGNIKAIGQGMAVISATTPERTLECAVTVHGGDLFCQDMENPNFTTLYDKPHAAGDTTWTRVQEDGNWVLDMDGSKFSYKLAGVYTSRLLTETNAVTMPASGYVIDFDVKTMSAEGHKAINFRTFDDEGNFYGYKVILTELEVGEWYDVRMVRTPTSYEGYYKKATDTEWTKNGDVVVGSGYNGSQQTAYNYVDMSALFQKNSSETAEADQYKTHFRMDNFRVYTAEALTGMTIEEASLEMNIGDVEALNAAFTPSYATDKHIVYTSSAPTVATVDRLGRITAVRAGNATITATTVDGGFVDTVSVVVSGPSLSVVKTESGSDWKFTVTDNASLTGGRVYIGGYNSQHQLVLATYGDYTSGVELTMAKNGDVSYYKVFVWDKNMTPEIDWKQFN